MTKTERVYSTSDPAVVAAYRDVETADKAMARRCADYAEALGKNKGTLIVNRRASGPEVIGLDADDPTDPPAGWRYSKRDEHLVPRIGKAGEAARQWLADHQPPDLRAVLAQHGLPRTAKPGPDFRTFLAAPGVFCHDGTVWAKYPAEPDGECTWARRRLSEWHAAREAAEDAAAQAKAEQAEAVTG